MRNIPNYLNLLGLQFLTENTHILGGESSLRPRDSLTDHLVTKEERVIFRLWKASNLANEGLISNVEDIRFLQATSKFALPKNLLILMQLLNDFDLLKYGEFGINHPQIFSLRFFFNLPAIIARLGELIKECEEEKTLYLTETKGALEITDSVNMDKVQMYNIIINRLRRNSAEFKEHKDYAYYLKSESSKQNKFIFNILNLC